MMPSKKWILCGLFAGLLLSGIANEKYANPALHKVKFEKPLAHAPLELVKNGELQFAIVCDLKAEKDARIVGTNKPVGYSRESLRIASGQLQKQLERCLGVKARILPPDSPELEKYRYKIYLGKSVHTDKYEIDIAKMPPDGFKIMTVPDGIIIAGRDGSLIPGSYQWNEMSHYNENGTAGAVFDFLERFLGMRFYYPGLGVIAPACRNLTIDPVAYTDHPKYLTRSFGKTAISFHNKGEKSRRIGMAQTVEWPWPEVKNDQSDFPAAWRLISRPTRWICSEGPHPYSIAKAFPDKLDICFARDKDGKLKQSFTQYTANYYDVSNLKFSELLAEAYQKFYTSKGAVNLLWDKWICPNPEYMYFGPVDAHFTIDNQVSRSLPQRTEHYATMSEVTSRFYEDLARRIEKTLPGKKIVFMAYANFLAAPKSIKKFPDNVQIMACAGTPVFIRDKASENFWKQLYCEWNGKIREKVVPYLYDPAYNMQGGISHAVRGQFEGEYLQKTAPYISDFALFPCVYFRWDYYYSNYLISRAYWNPDVNVKAVLDEHWKLLYGPAAPSLQKFYDLVIDRWIHHYIPNAKTGFSSIPGLDYSALYRKAYPPATLKEMKKLIDQAAKAVKKGSVEEKRVTFFSMPWQRIINEAASFGNIKTPAPVKVVWSEEPMTVDGKMDEPIWKKAVRIPFRTAYYGEKCKKSVPDTRMVWTRDGIYIGIFNPAPYKKNGKLWGEDNIEIFLSPGLVKNKLFQFVLSSSGQFEEYFQSFDPPRELESTWVCKDWRKAVQNDEKGWTFEMFIPFASLDKTASPIPGDSWFANLVNNRTDSEAASFAPTLGNNRNLNLYGKLHFAGNCE